MQRNTNANGTTLLARFSTTSPTHGNIFAVTSTSDAHSEPRIQRNQPLAQSQHPESANFLGHLRSRFHSTVLTRRDGMFVQLEQDHGHH